MNGSAENGLLVWNGQVGNPACVKERDRDAARPRFPSLPDARLGVVDRLLRVDDPRPRTLDVPDRPRHGFVEPVLDLGVARTALGGHE